MNAMYTGMNPDGTGVLTDTDHLYCSISNILTTPKGSRVMRREYGSLLPDLIDAPANEVTRLQCMSAAVIALTQWEPRIAVNSIDLTWGKQGGAILTLTGLITQTMQPVALTMPVRKENANH